MKSVNSEKRNSFFLITRFLILYHDFFS